MEESAQNLGAHGFTLFSRIVFPLALPGYVAGAALVFVKVFDDLATPLLLNVTNMLAPQAYLKITSVGITDPMGYVISVIMIVLLGRRHGAVGAAAARPRLRDPAARRRRARAPLARPRRQRDRGDCFVVLVAAARAVAAYRHFPAVDRDRVVVRGAARRLHARALRDGVSRGRRR